jgi:hypothetical protein
MPPNLALSEKTMFTSVALIPLVVAAVVVSVVVRLVLRVFGLRRGGGRGGYNGGSGYRRRRGLGGSLLSILALVALDRLFTFTSRRF